MAWAALCLLIITQPVFAEPLYVTVVLSEEGGAYQEFSDALRKRLAKQNVALNIAAMNQPVGDSDLIIAVGMKAAAAMATFKSVAIFNVFIPKEGYSKLQQNFPKRTTTYSAIYLDQPIERQFDLIAAALPNLRHIGILYADLPHDLNMLRQQAAEQKMTLHEQIVTPATGLSDALQELLHTSDVILALPDAEVYNVATIRNILLATYRANVPLVGFSSSFVRAGGLCAVFSTPTQIAKQTAGAINQFAETHTLPPAQYALEFEVLVNTQVMRSLNLTVPPPQELHSKIGGKQ